MNPINKYKDTETINKFAESLISSILDEIISLTETIVNEKLKLVTTEERESDSSISCENKNNNIVHGDSVIMSNDLLSISDIEPKDFDEKQIIFHSGDVFSEVCNNCLENEDLDDCFSMESTDKNSCSNGNRKYSEDSEYMLEGESDTDFEKLMDSDKQIFPDLSTLNDFEDFKHDLALLNLGKMTQQNDEIQNDGTLKRGHKKLIDLKSSLEEKDTCQKTNEVDIQEDHDSFVMNHDSATRHDSGWKKFKGYFLLIEITVNKICCRLSKSKDKRRVQIVTYHIIEFGA